MARFHLGPHYFSRFVLDVEEPVKILIQVMWA